VSTTVTVPVVGAAPMLPGVSVKKPVPEPCAKLPGVWVLVMRRSGVRPGTSAKLLPADTVFGPDRSMPVMVLGAVPGTLATPPVLPGVVMPLVVPGGCSGWVTV
jgi:hypothetical protein